jgi:hypothetical protein
MDPFELPSDRSARRRVLAPDLEPDVNCAAAVGLPVLISADADIAEWLARMIHDRSNRKAEAFVVFHPAGRSQLGLLKSVLNGSGPGRGTLFVAEVSKANRDVQEFLRDLLATPQPDPRAPFRIIAGTSVWLFDRMERGEFDHYLFYRLNKIHIRVGGRETIREDGREPDRAQAPGITSMDVAAFRRHRLMLRAGYVAPQPGAPSGGTTG